ncbi:hypothetical protein [Acaryochloris marina]|uniref:hypothetical protein n=1 Tax=Acaryochloris marina TaxID=155978 RepID=UPI0021C35E19|nr:hypothetical protein [Acaryochloris marina]
MEPINVTLKILFSARVGSPPKHGDIYQPRRRILMTPDLATSRDCIQLATHLAIDITNHSKLLWSDRHQTQVLEQSEELPVCHAHHIIRQHEQHRFSYCAASR